jgi:extracellular elastinolytic metalloproteinase
VTDPSDKNASPLGWNNDGSKSYTDTRGNNVDVSAGTFRGASTGDLEFTSTWNAQEGPTSNANKQASTVNLFYLINKIHDISYQVHYK